MYVKMSIKLLNLKMKKVNASLKIVVVFLLLCFPVLLYGENNSSPSVNKNAKTASALKGKDILKEIKEMPLTSDEHPVTLSLNGSVREQYRTFYNLDFGDASPDKDIYAMQRYILGADLHLNKSIRFYTELSSSTVNGKNFIKASDKDNLGLIQAYAEIFVKALSMKMKAGRQELDFGSGRVLGKKDGPNNGAYYDGFHNNIKFKKLNLDLFAAHPLEYRLGFFDNYTDTDVLIYGSYWSLPLKKKNILDFYLIASESNEIKLNNTIGQENRYSIGTRISQLDEAFTYDVEATWQTGKFGGKNISAWQLLATTGYQWAGTRMNPEVLLKASMFSSDRDFSDQTISLFRPIASKPAVNKFLPLGPANLVVLAPGGGVNFTEKLEFSLTYHAVWRKNLSDGLYSSSLESMLREPDTADVKKGRYVAGGPYLGLIYEANDNLSLTLNTGVLSPGKYLRNTGKGYAVTGFFIKAEYLF